MTDPMFIADYVILPGIVLASGFWVKRTKRLNRADKGILALILLVVATAGGVYFTP